MYVSCLMHYLKLIFAIFGPLEGSPYIVFTFTGSVRNVRNDVNIYIYIYIYIYMRICVCVDNMADAKSVRNLLAIFR